MQSTEGKFECLSAEDIFLYLEGELSPHQEFSADIHLARCKDCHAELNRQKSFVFEFDRAVLKADEVPLPEDFTKIVVARAESSVAGFRGKKEYGRVLVISLFLLALAVGLLPGAFTLLLSAAGRIVAVVSMISHHAYEITLGFLVILRSLSSQFAPSLFFTAALFVFLGFCLYLTFRFRSAIPGQDR